MVFSTLNQSFAFHSSPEAFISARLQELSTTSPQLVTAAGQRSGIARASILNRNVHIISSYQLCRDVLEYSEQQRPPLRDFGERSKTISLAKPESELGCDLFAVGAAYRELMAEFFPPPDLLLEDGDVHASHKAAWMHQVADLPEQTEPIIREICKTFVQGNMKPGAKIDLYDTMKDLAWELLLGVFLALRKEQDREQFAKMEGEQEILLRGQFSLFPVAVKTIFWQSARSKGVKARKDLQVMLKEIVGRARSTECPVVRGNAVDRDDIASHCLLFTSSIANKALASLLTATMMNLFLKPAERSLADLVRSQAGEERKRLLKSILLETERLSPPVVGVMRRVQQDILLGQNGGEHTVPRGHDLWLYFVGASRDPSVFNNASLFEFDRFIDVEAPSGFAFSTGGKTCLGASIVRKMISMVSEELLKSQIILEGSVESPGVCAWLGWQRADDPQTFARDLKQLPCQRPRDPVLVSIRKIEDIR